MFGINKTYNFETFEGLKEDELLVSSMFYSIQGEGPFMGRPAFFIRLTGCHRKCDFCDTDFGRGEVLTFKQIKKQFYEKMGQLPELVVITGGEPFLQKNIYSFIGSMQSLGIKFQFETSGDIKIEMDKFLLSDVTIVVSPKISQGRYILFDDFEKIETLLRYKTFFKFVVSGDRRSPYHVLPFDLLSSLLSRNRVCISPMNVYLRKPDIQSGERVSFWEEGLLDKKQVQINHEYAAELCLKYNFNLSLQMQLYCSLC